MTNDVNRLESVKNAVTPEALGAADQAIAYVEENALPPLESDP